MKEMQPFEFDLTIQGIITRIVLWGFNPHHAAFQGIKKLPGNKHFKLEYVAGVPKNINWQ